MSRLHKSRRPGAAVLIVVVILVIFGAMLSLAMQANLAARAESRRAAQRLQAEFLATSALKLTQARLGADAEYAGEAWPVPAAELDGRHAGSVTIEVAAVEGRPSERRVTIVATYPLDDEPWRAQRYRIEQTWTIDPISP